MKSKQISKLFAPLSGIMSFMFAMGIMTIPVSAEEINKADSAYEETVKTDYTTYINSTVEKDGFKITISRLTAAKNRMNVTAVIECPNDITQDALDNAIFMFTVKKSACESGFSDTKIVDNRKIEVSFNVTSFENLPSNADVRFDVIIPEYNLNAWVNTNVNLSKNFDKIIEKDIDIYNEKTKITCSKFEADVLGSSIYFKEDDYNENYDYDNEYSNSDSTILIKCDGKLYEFEDKDYNYYGEGNDGRYTCRNLTYDTIKNADSITLIPVICNLKNKDVDKIYESIMYDEDENNTETIDNVTYQKEFKFNDGQNGKVTKVKRDGEKVKFYINTDSENKSILMACGMYGWISGSDGMYGRNAEKVIYKDPDNEYGYIVEYGNVDEDSQLNMWMHDTILGYSSSFEIGQEVNIK